jgi:hypothetical protein
VVFRGNQKPARYAYARIGGHGNTGDRRNRVGEVARRVAQMHRDRARQQRQKVETSARFLTRSPRDQRTNLDGSDHG